MRSAVYLRLVITRRDEDSQRKQGVFAPAYILLTEGVLSRAEHERLRELLVWFEEHLPPPDRSMIEPGTIFWFKPGAGQLIKRVWDLVEILKEHGFHVELIKTRHPGRLCYVDDYQVGAVPFKNDSY